MPTKPSLREAIHRLRRDQDGSAAASVGFAIFGTIVMATIVLTATGVVRTNSFIASETSMSQAIDQRFNSFQAAYASSTAAPTTSEVCYTDRSTCVGITSVVKSGPATIVTLTARWTVGTHTLVQRKTIGTPAVAYIVGYDTAGTAVWSAPGPVSARNNVRTLAGSGAGGSANGAPGSATFSSLSALTVDAFGNVYIADTGNNRIRKVTPTGTVSDFSTGLNQPRGITIDSSGNFYVADTGSNTVKKITAAGVVSLVAGSGGAGGFSEGSGASAKFNAPTGIAVDKNGVLFVTDSGNNRIRQITTAGIVSTFAGNGTAASGDGSGSNATFNNPKGIAFGPNGSLYVADFAGNKIRKISTSAAVTTFAGTGTTGAGDGPGAAAQFNGPSSVAVTATGTVYVADTLGNTVRALSPTGAVTTFAGWATAGAAEGVGVAAQFRGATGVGLDASGALYVADTGNNKVRKIN
jgi:serine/threonine-protein kinase